MGTQRDLSNEDFWLLVERYRRYAQQKIKKDLSRAGHKGLAFYYQLTSMSLLLKTFQKTPRLGEIITAFDSAYVFDRIAAPSKAIFAAQAVNLNGLVTLGEQYIDTNLENLNEEAYRYWLAELQKLEKNPSALTPEESILRNQGVAKFLVKNHTLRSQVKLLEPHFTMEKIRLEADNSSALEEGERENEAVEAIVLRVIPELFNETQHKDKTNEMDIAKATSRPGTSGLAFEKLEWQGTQKELAELLVELKQKGWIKEIVKETIRACFTKSGTIDQVLKPNRDHKYPEIYTPAYSPKFNAIKNKPAPKSSK